MLPLPGKHASVPSKGAPTTVSCCPEGATTVVVAVVAVVAVGQAPQVFTLAVILM